MLHKDIEVYLGNLLWYMNKKNALNYSFNDTCNLVNHFNERNFACNFESINSNNFAKYD